MVISVKYNTNQIQTMIFKQTFSTKPLDIFFIVYILIYTNLTLMRSFTQYLLF